MQQQKSYIDQFVEQFKKDYKEYERVCDKARQLVDNIVKQNSIMAIVTARVKDPERLREKLNKRNAERQEKNKAPYGGLDDIYEDIGDLIGLRIALYFPSEAQKIGALLKPHFDVSPVKTFPAPVENFDALYQEGFTAYKRRVYKGYHERCFDGYRAHHYRVKYVQPPSTLIRNPVMEIQVASVLMHAWSEVEHDLAYKKKKGEVSREEYECLDEINGLVMAGEIALNRLNQLSQQRLDQDGTVFATNFALGAYLQERQKKLARTDEEQPLGNVETLFSIYKEKNLLTKVHVDSELEKLEKQAYGREEPLADRLIEQFAAGNNQTLMKKIVSSTVMKFNDLDPETFNQAQLGKYMGKWNALEKTILATLRRLGYKAYNSAATWHFVVDEKVLTEPIREEYRRLRLERNKIVHGYRAPSADEFAQLNAAIDQLSTMLKETYGE